jgi:hypothetical protein
VLTFADFLFDLCIYLTGPPVSPKQDPFVSTF